VNRTDKANADIVFKSPWLLLWVVLCTGDVGRMYLVRKSEKGSSRP